MISSSVASKMPEQVDRLVFAKSGKGFIAVALVYFGGFASHIGFYATPEGHTEFSEELSKYKQGKGSVQFPLDQPLPEDLVKRMVAFKKQQLGG